MGRLTVATYPIRCLSCSFEHVDPLIFGAHDCAEVRTIASRALHPSARGQHRPTPSRQTGRHSRDDARTATVVVAGRAPKVLPPAAGARPLIHDPRARSEARPSRTHDLAWCVALGLCIGLLIGLMA